MKKNKFALQIISFGLIVLSFIACDKDFATLESDIINDENATNFDILSLRETNPEFTEVIAYTKDLEPVQTNGLPINTLGIYDDVYGRTTSTFVTQLTTSSFDPSFGDGVSIDSVVLKIPYFSVATDVNDDGDFTYKIDSVIGREKMILRIYENNYFIRDFDPTADFDESQAYFSDKSASTSEDISALEGEELVFLTGTGPHTSNTDIEIENKINISEEGFILKELDDDGVLQVSERQTPGIRVKLDPAFWQTKIIDKEGDAVLSSQNRFTEYFRGLYFKAETVDDDGSFLILNTGSPNSNIIIYYTRLTPSTNDDPDETEQATFELNFGPNRINFMDNDFSAPIDDGDAISGDSRIYLKGGEGSLARVKLFNGDDIDEDPEINVFEEFKNTFVETDIEGNFVKAKRLVNEANLVFYVDRDLLDQEMEDPDNEPNRIYLYDVENKSPLFDYFLDATSTTLPSFSKYSHLGLLERDEQTEKGIKYKLKITDHINNLLLRDSTNVELGLAVSLNVNLEEFTQRKIQSATNPDLTLPLSSIITPRGTVLFGNNIPDNDINNDKKVYLEVYYTCPEGEDCD